MPNISTSKRYQAMKFGQLTELASEIFFTKNDIQNLMEKLKPRTKYLRKTLVFMWNSALPEKFYFDIQGVFC